MVDKKNYNFLKTFISKRNLIILLLFHFYNNKKTSVLIMTEQKKNLKMKYKKELKVIYIIFIKKYNLFYKVSLFNTIF